MEARGEIQKLEMVVPTLVRDNLEVFREIIRNPR